MKVTFLIAEGAGKHVDQTVSILRAGLNRVTGPRLPIPFRAAVVILFEAEPGDVGPHRYAIRCVSEDGRDLIAPICEEFAVTALPATHSIVQPLAGGFLSVGKVRWLLEVDQEVRAQTTMLVALEEG